MVIRGNCQFSISTFTSKGSTAVSEIRVTTYNSSYEQRQQQLVEDRDAVANCLTVRATPIRPHAAWAATPAHRPTHTDTRPTRAHCSVIDYSRCGVYVCVLVEVAAVARAPCSIALSVGLYFFRRLSAERWSNFSCFDNEPTR